MSLGFLDCENKVIVQFERFVTIFIKFDRDKILSLAHIWPMFPFYTHWKHQKNFGFLVFSGGITFDD